MGNRFDPPNIRNHLILVMGKNEKLQFLSYTNSITAPKCLLIDLFILTNSYWIDHQFFSLENYMAKALVILHQYQMYPSLYEKNNFHVILLVLEKCKSIIINILFVFKLKRINVFYIIFFYYKNRIWSIKSLRSNVSRFIKCSFKFFRV